MTGQASGPVSGQASGPASANAARFVSGTTPGARIVVRYRIEGMMTDALGLLSSVDDTNCVVETKRGPVEIALADIALAKAVPPAPEPRRPRSESR
ncbi:putative acetyltransferase [Marisediminicola antarctica]|uniref:putative acetyltransferase n=1 Tax=Marisediminicola antarctica TaxID=674079 RepID=UPI001F37CBC2|nr:hypothetical protein [Marisediminicola antarctica]